MSSIQFCRSCNNMMYPKENKATKTLMFRCTRCRIEEPASNPVVYRHQLVRDAANEQELIPDSVIYDPTLSRDKSTKCDKCGHFGAVFIQTKPKPTDTKMKVMAVCDNPDCIHKWAM